MERVRSQPSLLFLNQAVQGWGQSPWLWPSSWPTIIIAAPDAVDLVIYEKSTWAISSVTIIIHIDVGMEAGRGQTTCLRSTTPVSWWLKLSPVLKAELSTLGVTPCLWGKPRCFYMIQVEWESASVRSSCLSDLCSFQVWGSQFALQDVLGMLSPKLKWRHENSQRLPSISPAPRWQDPAAPWDFCLYSPCFYPQGILLESRTVLISGDVQSTFSVQPVMAWGENISTTSRPPTACQVL